MLHIQFPAFGDVLTEDAWHSPEDVLAEEYIRTITISLFQHFLPIAIACMLTASLFAWAYLTNKEVEGTKSVAQEALRKQRWQMAKLSLLGLLGSSLPAILLLVTGYVDARIWALIIILYLPILWGGWRYVKIIRLSRRDRQRTLS